ncbi:MAG: peptidyl-alpha-hydroxyglycine alpha-amidating lyase family protein [Candidatus Poribacteria bacterium]|nr:peptidyl-alpha-hydroxyglycine alpha-amidating lyase family protein [Candidatus Poribacteria bacterium]
MTMTSRSDKPAYEIVEGWGPLPEGWEFKQVAGVAVDSQDRIYVYNRGEHPVIVFDTDGNVLHTWGEGFLKHAHGIFIDAADTVYLVDRFLHAVLKYSPEGELLMTIGTLDQPGENGDPFNHPTDVALSSSGEIYVSDGYGNARLHKFSAEGEHLLSWGVAGDSIGEFNLPHSVWVDDADRVYVADRENHRIQIFNPEGTFIDQWTGFRQPTDLFLDSAGRFYVAELQHRVSILNHDGEILARMGGDESRAPGQFVAPHAVWTDSKGDLYVGEVLEGQRIQKFVRTG